MKLKKEVGTVPVLTEEEMRVTAQRPLATVLIGLAYFVSIVLISFMSTAAVMDMVHPYDLLVSFMIIAPACWMLVPRDL